MFAVSATIDDTTDASQISDFEFSYVSTYSGNTSYYFMSGNNRIGSSPPNHYGWNEGQNDKYHNTKYQSLHHSVEANDVEFLNYEAELLLIPFHMLLLFLFPYFYFNVINPYFGRRYHFIKLVFPSHRLLSRQDCLLSHLYARHQ